MDGRPRDLCLFLCYFIVITVLLWDDVIMWRKVRSMGNQSKKRQTGKRGRETQFTDFSDFQQTRYHRYKDTSCSRTLLVHFFIRQKDCWRQLQAVQDRFVLNFVVIFIWGTVG
jgi:hypothetical protein